MKTALRIARDMPWKFWALVAGLLLIVLLVLGFCSSQERLGQADDRAIIDDGRTASAIDAIDAIGDNAGANAETITQVEEAQDAIRQADPADRDRVARCELRKLQGLTPC